MQVSRVSDEELSKAEQSVKVLCPAIRRTPSGNYKPLRDGISSYFFMHVGGATHGAKA